MASKIVFDLSFKNLTSVLLVAAGFVFGAGTAACDALQKDAKTAHDAIVLAQDACVVLRDLAPDGGATNQICAREAELIPFISQIEHGRAHSTVADSGVPADR